MNIDKVLLAAEKACARSGARLTHKRKQVLLSLLRCGRPLSAYEISDHLKDTFTHTIPPMSVYRMLDFLVHENLVHKLSSTGKYIVCSHINGGHSHPVAQFLICDICGHVHELDTNQETIAALEASATEAGYALQKPQLELHCVCQSCTTEDDVPTAPPQNHRRG